MNTEDPTAIGLPLCTVHALVTAVRDRCVQKSRHSGLWMPSFQRYCQWWEQLFDVALWLIDHSIRTAVPQPSQQT